MTTGSVPTTADTELDALLKEHFAGKIVRKALTKLVKEGANVPIYVLEYLLGMNCSSNDEAVNDLGLSVVKGILSDNYVRPDEAEKIKSKIREKGSYKVIDRVTVRLNEKRDTYEATLSNLGIKGVEVPASTVKEFEKLLAGGIWSVISLQYFYEEGQKGSPFSISSLRPIQTAEHGHGGSVCRPWSLHDGAVDRRLGAVLRHGALRAR